MHTERCPNCKKETVVPGRVNGCYRAANRRFEPSRFVWFRLWGRAPVCSLDFRACFSCGHVWTCLRPEELRAFIVSHGDAETQHQLSQSQKPAPELELQ